MYKMVVAGGNLLDGVDILLANGGWEPGILPCTELQPGSQCRSCLYCRGTARRTEGQQGIGNSQLDSHRHCREGADRSECRLLPHTNTNHAKTLHTRSCFLLNFTHSLTFPVLFGGGLHYERDEQLLQQLQTVGARPCSDVILHSKGANHS